MANVTEQDAASAIEKASQQIVDLCCEALEAEAAAVAAYAVRRDPGLERAVRLLRDAKGTTIVSGVGKSGHIARKIASTLRSIGKPAIFLHATEASHGDLGVVGEGSAAIIISNSGETPELSDLLHYCRHHSVPIIAITSSPESTLGRHAHVALAYGSVSEVCPNGLAPTTSTTLALAIGDALAVGLATLLGSTAETFRRFHPGGKLGARLLRVADVMRTGDALPIVSAETPMHETVITMSAKGFGVAIVSAGDRAVGLITDGDMRRNVERLWNCKAGDIIQGKPLATEPDLLVTEALERMRLHSITSLIVEDASGRLVGLLHIHDCLRAI
ncbi:KpsF/GutQ family sugar-phosphate isomerase [Chelativorans sp. Marseille-P2723]|uniref:KpsF/GutQ family sugar-phosphate isomerase n=1 Tax=Chelativorans sp. Marseille-P2723 TaxID=2709133 RepID=UPI001AEE1C4B|nr:KpsF/GutQ family sugar-phosphate isomerase [Chelativorans sp. Marseille-P2723]